MNTQNAALRFLTASALVSLAVLGTSDAHAGTTSTVSSIAAMPKLTALKIPALPTSVPGLALKTTDTRSSKWHELTTATGRGYCIQTDQGTGLQWTNNFGSSDRGATVDLDLVRLVAVDEKVTLERTHVQLEPTKGEIVATGRSQVELHELTRDNGVVVWAYRDGRHIVVLARNVDRGIEARRATTSEESDPVFPFVSIDACPFAGVRLDTQKTDRGTFAQLVGSMPAKGTGKDKVTPRFTVDASLSRVARDPEAKISVRVRMRD